VIRERVKKSFSVYREFSGTFWTLVGARFVDAVGGAMIFPFFTLYITARFDVDLVKVGVVFGLVTVTGIVGSAIGGMLADKFGRKLMVMFGLVVSATTSLLLVVVEDFTVFSITALFVGLFGSIGGPANGAMVADLVPEEQRAQGFGIFRVVHNLAVTIGPAIGGVVAGIAIAETGLYDLMTTYLGANFSGLFVENPFALLFVLDAVSSIFTAAIVWWRIPETKPQTEPESAEHVDETSAPDKSAGYGPVLRDTRYMVFLAASMLMVLCYIQMNGTLAVYLRDFHSLSTARFGWIISLNAGMVVLFQFAITRRIEGYAQMAMMALGSALLVVGFGMYGFVSTYGLFMLAMAIITVGEMIVAPVGQAIAAEMSPEDMRGRYMAFYGFSWSIPNAIGLALAGMVIKINPDLVWYASAGSAAVATISFWLLHLQVKKREAEEAKAEVLFPATDAAA
jgi:MFS family permease